MPPIDFHPELVDGIGKWYIHHAETIPGYHYQLEQLSADGQSWHQANFWYGHGQDIKHFVTDGPMPPAAASPNPPAAGPPWLSRNLWFKLEIPAHGAPGQVRLSRGEATYSERGENIPNPPPPLPPWDEAMSLAGLPPLPPGTRYLPFQSWTDPVNKVLWHSEIEVIALAAPSGPSADTLPASPEQAAELGFFHAIKDQLTGGMSAPSLPPGPPPVSDTKVLRLRRTVIDANHNSVPDWWELQEGFNPFAVPGQQGYFDPAGDADFDGLSNGTEFRLGTDYQLADTDGDGSPDPQDTSPLLASVHPPLFDFYWRGMGGHFYFDWTEPQTGWTGTNWAFPQHFDAAITAWNTPGQARSQLVPSAAWPATFAMAQVWPTPPAVVDLHWDSYQYDVAGVPWRYSNFGTNERLFRCRRDFGHPWQQDVTLLRLILPPAPSYQPEFQIGQVEAIEKIELPIPSGETVSAGVELRIPAADPAWQTQFGEIHRRHYFTELHRLPPVLAVNSNFDEGIIDPATGYAKPDSSDNNLKADRDIPWREIKQGDPLTTDLHQGWFGIRPDAFFTTPPYLAVPPWSFFHGASIKIKKISQTDPDTDAPESGHIRFWVTRGDGQNAEAWPIDPYDRNDPAFPPTELVGVAYGPEATVAPPAAKVRYWVEGVTPGKCTLQFTCIRGPHTISHQQTFLVATQQPKTKWLEDIRQQILVQSGGGLDLGEFIPAEGYLPRPAPESAFGSNLFIYHHPRVRGIYEWYGQLYQQYPEKLDWMGAASLVGGAVYGGLCEMHAPTNITYGFQSSVGPQLQGGAVLIYRDLGWQHRAWIASGLWALQWVSQNDPSSVNALPGQSALEYPVWQDFDKAIRENNWTNIKLASRRLVRREQAEVIGPMWTAIRDTNAGTGTTSGFLFAAASFPTFFPKNAADPEGPNFQQVVPGGNVDHYIDRDRFSFGWDGMRSGQPPVAPAIAAKGVFPVWWGEQTSSYGTLYHSARRLHLVRLPFLDRAAVFAQPTTPILGR